jgi:hypothetical protein
MPYTITLEATIRKTDEDGNGEEFASVQRFYDGQELFAIGSIGAHFTKVMQIAVADADIASEGEKLGMSED